MSTKPLCDCCHNPVNPHRYDLGYTVCKPCGEKQARQKRHTIVPMHKSNYMVVTDMSLLKQLNKGGLVR